MTIDEVIKKENKIAVKFQKAVDAHQLDDDGFCKSLADYHKQIADTMRKYQKIEGIVRAYYNDEYVDKLDIEVIEMISEVLCDGNDD